jgi:hypothetical protein
MTTTDILLAVFTGILAIAVLIQTLLFFGIYRSIRQLTSWMDGFRKDVLRNVEAISGKVDEGLATIKGIAEGIRPIREKLAATTDIVHRRVTEVDDFLAEATKAARLEILRVQDAIESASEKVEQTLELLRRGVVIPLTEINAISRAIRVALDVLFRRRKNSSSTSPQDEEMFI